jgi:hypothetical protein
MASITVHAVHADSELRRWTLSERIAGESLDGEHYATQLLGRVRWATADAEALEPRSADLDTDPRRRCAAHAAESRVARGSPVAAGHEQDLADAAWLYAWSVEALCPAAERLSVRVIAAG